MLARRVLRYFTLAGATVSGASGCWLFADLGSNAGGPGAGDEIGIIDGDASEASIDSGAIDADTDTGRDAGSLYANVVLADQPLGYWRLGDSESATGMAIDSSGHNHDGLYFGPVKSAPGAIANDPNTAAAFNGNNTWVDVADDVFGFTGTTPFSVEAWVLLLSDTPQRSYCVLSKDGYPDGGQGYVWSFAQNPAVDAQLEFLRGPFANAGIRSVFPRGPAFHHVVISYDGTNLSLYVDGVLFAQQKSTSPNPGVSAHFVIGADIGGQSCWYAGAIDEVAVYGSALSLASVKAHCHAGGGGDGGGCP